VLRPLKDIFHEAEYPDLLVGLEVADDAAVYRINDEVAVIQTTDFFTPIVDDPYAYGAIAAANAMSDVYAMGGQVVLALNIAAFPADMDEAIIIEILRGGAEKVKEAGGVIAGGHTIDDEEPKYGLAVTGSVHPDRIATKGGAQPGDVLALTKPLGVGIITTAFKSDVADLAHVEAATQSMMQLNKRAVEAMQGGEFHAATDITGFGLLGHAYEMADKSGACLRFRFDDLPFHPGAKDYAEQLLFPGGANRNRDAYNRHVRFASRLEYEMQLLLFTPETSGGLLIAIPAKETDALLARCAALGQSAWIVGEVVGGEGIEVL
jgi:selenide,water dikinase